MNRDHVSHHMDRKGFHFHNSVVNEVIKRRNQEVDREGPKPAAPTKRNQNSVSITRPGPISSKLRRRGKQLGLPAKGGDSALRTQQVSDVVKEIFPKIPNDDLKKIVRQAFKEVLSHLCRSA